MGYCIASCCCTGKARKSPRRQCMARWQQASRGGCSSSRRSSSFTRLVAQLLCATHEAARYVNSHARQAPLNRGLLRSDVCTALYPSVVNLSMANRLSWQLSPRGLSAPSIRFSRLSVKSAKVRGGENRWGINQPVVGMLDPLRDKKPRHVHVMSYHV